MFKQSVNELEIQLSLQGRGHLLVKDGRYNVDVKKAWLGEGAGPSMIFISRNPAEDGVESVRSILRAGQTNAEAYEHLDVYLPGSSVRGAWRSHLEKALRSLGGPTVCDPLMEKGRGDSCSSRLQPAEGPPSEFPYRDSCPVCKIFGDTAHGSRVSISDGEVEGRKKLVRVDNVAIQRQTGSVAAPFTSLVLRNAKFGLTLRLRNFELWQVGLIGHLVDDLSAGRVPIGSGKNKGWGQVNATITGMTVSYFGLRDPLAEGVLKGIGELAPGEKYGFIASGVTPTVGTAPVPAASSLWRHTRQITDIAGLWAAVKPCFNEEVWTELALDEQRRAHG